MGIVTINIIINISVIINIPINISIRISVDVNTWADNNFMIIGIRSKRIKKSIDIISRLSLHENKDENEDEDVGEDVGERRLKLRV